MARSPQNVLANHAHGAREEASEALDHLLTAAAHGVSQLGRRSRHAGAVARERAALAGYALRGQRPDSPWIWAASGLSVGLAVGVIAGMIIGRRPVPGRTTEDGQPGPPIGDVLADKARDAAQVVRTKTESAAQHVTEVARDRANAAAHNAAATARGAAAKVRDRSGD